MKDLISLTKVGNLKLGRVKNGKPIATERILVTLPTKENQENFKIMPGFNEEGETEVNITLPFDDPELNFEVNYVGFATVDEVEYIVKVHDFGEDVILYPLNVEDFDKPAINMGEFTNEMQEKLQLRKTGFLKAHLIGYSGFGEVFYFKTHSINSIRAIQDQLKILTALTGGKMAGIPLVMRAIKKDVNNEQIVYASISFKGESSSLFDFAKENTVPSLGSWIEKRKESPVDIKAFEAIYKESRTLKEDEVIPFEELKNVKFEINTNTEAEIAQIQTEAEKQDMSDEEKFVIEFFKEKEITKIPTTVGLGLYKTLANEEKFVEYFKEERTLPEITKYMRDIK